jgi:sugar phosphate isomerase/epimerase
MFPVGICTAVANADLLQRAGADFIEENAQKYLRPEEPAPVWAPVAPPVRVANCFLPGKLKVTGPAPQHEAIVRYAAIVFTRAQTAGIATIVFGAGGSRRIPDGFSRAAARSQMIALLQTLGPLAAAHGITLALEQLNRTECNFINTLAEAADIVAACDHPNIRLLADLYHMAREGDGPDALRQHGRWLHHVHVAEKEKRTAPGVAGDDFRPFLRALRDVGYRGAISFECSWTDLNTQAAGSLAAFRKQMEDVSC